MTNIKNIDVFILCGGQGKRLKKISGAIPKPLVKVGGQAFLDILINYLSGFGLRRFILGIGYKAAAFQAYYRTKAKAGLEFVFSCEQTPLGTGGALKNAKALIKSNPFFVVNGDSFLEFDPMDFLRFHRKKKAMVSVLLRQVSCAADYGQIEIDRAKRIVSFNEKIDSNSGLINAGVYLFDRKIYDFLPDAERFSLERDFFPQILTKRCFGFAQDGFFVDIGTPQRYLQAQRYFTRKSPLYPPFSKGGIKGGF